MNESNIIKCQDCYKPISKNATKCPHCGAPTPRQQNAAQWGIIFGLGWVAWITWMFYGNNIRLWFKIHFG